MNVLVSILKKFQRDREEEKLIKLSSEILEGISEYILEIPKEKREEAKKVIANLVSQFQKVLEELEREGISEKELDLTKRNIEYLSREIIEDFVKEMNIEISGKEKEKFRKRIEQVIRKEIAMLKTD